MVAWMRVSLVSRLIVAVLGTIWRSSLREPFSSLPARLKEGTTAPRKVGCCEAPGALVFVVIPARFRPRCQALLFFSKPTPISTRTDDERYCTFDRPAGLAWHDDPDRSQGRPRCDRR